MQAISEYNVTWTEQPWGRTAQIAPNALWQEVAPHQSFAPEKLGSGQELITVTLAGGAQVRVAERVLRPLAGQILQRESGEELEIVNDTMQPVRLLRVTLA
ncbi:hypothetical protein JST97_27440 [bacterium]|nr:hypothetical protein [bacterium]